MGGLAFISYRRDDAAGTARHLYSVIKRSLPNSTIFMDVDGIEPGRDFVEVLASNVQRCDVLLALVGRSWATISDANGARRLDNENDYVRNEIAAALKRDIRVIPVLVDGATMPSEDQLPHELKPFARRHALRITHERFDQELDDLVKKLQAIFESMGLNESASPPAPLVDYNVPQFASSLLPDPNNLPVDHWYSVASRNGEVEQPQERRIIVNHKEEITIMDWLNRSGPIPAMSVGPHVTHRQWQNFKKNWTFALREFEILAFIDLANAWLWFRRGASGLAICRTALYYHNERARSDYSRSVTVSFSEFLRMPISSEGRVLHIGLELLDMYPLSSATVRSICRALIAVQENCSHFDD